MSAGVIVDDAIVWKADTINGLPCSVAIVGTWLAIVWHVGGETAWRSRLCKRTGLEPQRVRSHWSEDTAKRNAEKRLRKVAT